MSRAGWRIRRAMLDDLAALNQLKYDDYQDPQTQVRIKQYEMAFRMQSSVPELADLSSERGHVFERYGPEAKKPGTLHPTVSWHAGWPSAV